MGIQDRDYWQDWKRGNEGEGPYRKPFPGGSGGSGQPSRRFKIIDEVRAPVRRQSQRPLPQTDHVPEVLLKKLTYLAVFVALVVAAMLAYRWYALHQLNQSMLRLMNDVPKAMTAPIQQSLQVQSQSTHQVEERRKQLALERDLEMQRAIARQELKDRLDREHAERVQRRNAAWERFYQPSHECRRDATVECANAFIRAQRAFSEQYKD